MSGRTVIVITHRPALADLADSIITIQDGKAHLHAAVSGS
jgi:ABC-type lipoprotein export system ATPase subunit